jgi:hypothetical protein
MIAATALAGISRDSVGQSLQVFGFDNRIENRADAVAFDGAAL